MKKHCNQASVHVTKVNLVDFLDETLIFNDKENNSGTGSWLQSGEEQAPRDDNIAQEVENSIGSSGFERVSGSRGGVLSEHFSIDSRVKLIIHYFVMVKLRLLTVPVDEPDVAVDLTSLQRNRLIDEPAKADISERVEDGRDCISK